MWVTRRGGAGCAQQTRLVCSRKHFLENLREPWGPKATRDYDGDRRRASHSAHCASASARHRRNRDHTQLGGGGPADSPNVLFALKTLLWASPLAAECPAPSGAAACGYHHAFSHLQLPCGRVLEFSAHASLHWLRQAFYREGV